VRYDAPPVSQTRVVPQPCRAQISAGDTLGVESPKVPPRIWGKKPPPQKGALKKKEHPKKI